MLTREAVYRRVDALLDALERESGANSEASRDKAQEEGVAAIAALLRATGGRDLLRRRTMIAGRSLPPGALVDAADFEQFADEYVKGSPEDENRIRSIVARHAQDMTDLLTQRVAGVFTDTMLQNHDGRWGALNMPARRRGVEMRPGWPENVRIRIMDKAGYTAGAEFGDGRIPNDFWKRVARAQRNELMQNPGYRKHTWRPATARDYSQTGDAGRVFQAARRAGIAAKKLGKIDPARLL